MRKPIALFLCVIMAASIFLAACSEKQQGSAGSAPTENTVGTGAAVSGAAAAEAPATGAAAAEAPNAATPATGAAAAETPAQTGTPSTATPTAPAEPELVEYKGKVHHIFFHSLIIYPSLAFDDIGHSKAGYNSTMATRDEFVKILPQLYERGYVLYNINDLFERNAGGAMVRKKIYLPKGKKPLVLSQDDVSYYDYMEPDGFATRLVVDANGEISTEVKDPSGNVSITRDGDVVPILDDFLKEHPDFSYRGAKGIIALTGYEGVLGYRLEKRDHKKNKKQIAAAKKVADALKADGWLFASHSFTHNGPNYWGENSQPSKIAYDLKRWREVVRPVVGKTNLFIAPFGYVLPKKGMDVVAKAGYNIYCSVDSQPILDTSRPKIALMGRYEIAGWNMVHNKKNIDKNFFDVDSVIEKTRPKEMSE